MSAHTVPRTKDHTPSTSDHASSFPQIPNIESIVTLPQTTQTNWGNTREAHTNKFQEIEHKEASEEPHVSQPILLEMSTESITDLQFQETSAKSPTTNRDTICPALYTLFEKTDVHS